MDNFEEGESSNQNQNDVSEENQEASESNSGDVATNNGNQQEQRRSIISRIRRLVSQSTFQEDALDNQANNYPQNRQEENSVEEEEENLEDHDRLFEEYMRENQEQSVSTQAPFDCEMPSMHSYLGETENVRGCSFFEPGKVYDIPILPHHSLIFPHEIVPMIMLNDRCLSQNEDGLVFGLNFENHTTEGDKTYGVVCEVYEKGVDHHGHITVKSRARQRYVVVEQDGKTKEVKNGAYHSMVKILPEILLEEPYFLNISNSLLKHARNQSTSDKLKSFAVSSTRWPKFVYDHYSVKPISEKIERYLALLGIESPKDPSLKTWWLARNVPLNPDDRLKIFKIDCVSERLHMIGNSLNFVAHFLCKLCRNKITVYNDIFAISKGNVNANYCNPAGYIHETLTVSKVFDNSLRMVDRPSAEFSWFPGYAWQIAICNRCQSHIGWKFIAINNRNLRPRIFYGLSCKSLVVSPQDGSKEEERREASTEEEESSDFDM